MEIVVSVQRAFGVSHLKNIIPTAFPNGSSV
jgi:hypothetical protein